MPELVIEGTYKLNGSTKIQGSKNAVLPIIAATVLINGKSIIKNCPELSDVMASIRILENLGAKCEFKENVLTVDGSKISGYTIPEVLMREMRSSSLFLGAIIGRNGKAIISSPGGCELGPRPIDLHIKSLNLLGATVKDKNGYILFSADKGLKGDNVHLSFPSVGATENVILAAVTASGKTVLYNAAKEPEIIDLADFLNKCGGDIKGAGTDIITINGVSKLNPTEYSVIPDRIVASTYISAVAATGGEIKLTNVNPEHLSSVISVFRESGCEFKIYKDEITVYAPDRIAGVSTVRTLTYPGFPTDAGPMLIAALSASKGTTVFVETIFENRFRYIDELKRLGANIKTEGKIAIVEGMENLSAAQCVCTDLRGGAALVVAALKAKGTTRIGRICHIKRGYEDIVRDLRKFGAEIYEE